MRKHDKTEAVLEGIESVSALELPPIVGWHRKETVLNRRFLPIIGRKKGALLEKLVRKQKPKFILEIGTLVGYSAILMARNLKKGKIISLEIDKNAAKIAQENIANADLSDKVEIVVGDAKKTIKKLDKRFDFIFIDAKKEEYFAYLKLLENKMKKGCVIVADNAKIFAEAMEDYLYHVRNSGVYKSEFYDFGTDGVEVSTRLQ